MPGEARRPLAEQTGTYGPVRRLAAEQESAAGALEPQLAATPAANSPQLAAVRQLTEPIREQLAALAKQALASVRKSQQESIECAIARLREQLAVLARDAESSAIVERVVEQQRSVLTEALGRVQ